MSELLLHPTSQRTLSVLIEQTPHALLLVAGSGSGKTAVARLLASKLLGIDLLQLNNYPYYKEIKPDDRQTISIEAIRDMIRFTSLKTTTKPAISRIIVIENSNFMTAEAQNALLKTLEEPPTGTTIILTSPSEQLLLPTVVSRVQVIYLPMPDNESLKNYFENEGYNLPEIEQAILMSGGLPGLMHALLQDDEEHPLLEATRTARSIIGQTSFERLTLIDELAKNKQLCLDTLFILEQMAHIALGQTSKTDKSIKQWQKILSLSYEAHKLLLSNAQIKLVLLNFMLAI